MMSDKKKQPHPSCIKVAVTGSAGSGKSRVCARLKEYGLTVINLDVLAREAVTPGSVTFQKIIDAFGENVVGPDGHLNRPLLRDMIIKNNTARQRLEALVHPQIIHLMNQYMQEAERRGDPAVVVEVPLLFEFGLDHFFDISVNVSADQEKMIRRLMDRDNISRHDAAALLKLQLPDDEKSDRAQVVLKNNGSLDEINHLVDRFYLKFIQKKTKTMESP